MFGPLGSRRARPILQRRRGPRAKLLTALVERLSPKSLDALSSDSHLSCRNHGSTGIGRRDQKGGGLRLSKEWVRLERDHLGTTLSGCQLVHAYTGQETRRFRLSGREVVRDVDRVDRDEEGFGTRIGYLQNLGGKRPDGWLPKFRPRGLIFSAPPAWASGAKAVTITTTITAKLPRICPSALSTYRVLKVLASYLVGDWSQGLAAERPRARRYLPRPTKSMSTESTTPPVCSVAVTRKVATCL